MASAVLSPEAISDAQGWCSVMAYTVSALAQRVMLGRGRSPMGHRGPDDVVAAVILAADAVEGLDVDGVGTRTGGSSPAPQATHWGMGLTSG